MWAQWSSLIFNENCNKISWQHQAVHKHSITKDSVVFILYRFLMKWYLTSCCFRAVRVASSRCSSAPMSRAPSESALTEVTGSSWSTLSAQFTISLCLSRRSWSSCSPARAACSLSPTLLRSTTAAALNIPIQEPFLLSMLNDQRRPGTSRNTMPLRITASLLPRLLLCCLDFKLPVRINFE